MADDKVADAALGPLSPVSFRQALGQFPTGVTVVTASHGDQPIGMTANSFSSVSLDPPLVLWSLGEAASTLPIFTGNSHYVINVLAAGQEELAMRFSRRSIADPFEDVPYELSRTGQPILAGVSAWLVCHNRSRYPEGDHVIFVGEVEECAVHAQPALLYHGGKFGSTQK